MLAYIVVLFFTSQMFQHRSSIHRALKPSERNGRKRRRMMLDLEFARSFSCNILAYVSWWSWVLFMLILGSQHLQQLESQWICVCDETTQTRNSSHRYIETYSVSDCQNCFCSFICFYIFNKYICQIYLFVYTAKIISVWHFTKKINKCNPIKLYIKTFQAR